MSYETINFSMPRAMKVRIEEEARNGNFASVSDFLRDVVRDYLEDKRIERLVLEGLKDKGATPLTKQDFIDMKAELSEYIKNRE